MMKKVSQLFVLTLVLLTACTSEMDLKVKQSTIVFNDDALPEEMLRVLSPNSIIHVGEYHNHDAHGEFLTQLVINLDTHNLLLIEMSHALEWIVEDYTLGKLKSMPAFMEPFNQVDFDEIRAFNQNVDEQHKIIVKTIDINHSPKFLATSVRTMIDLGYIELIDPIREYLDNYSDEAYVQKLQNHLLDEQEALILKWGEKQYERLVQMVTIEMESIYCRAPLEEGDDALRSIRREAVMKSNVERNIALYGRPTIINTGFYHTQKSRVFGTDHEWLGEYLEYVSPSGKDNTYHLVVVPVEGAINWSDDGSITKYSSLLEYSGSNELFKTMLNSSEGKSTFLDFDASDYFSTENLKMNFHYEILEAIPNQLFDGVLLLNSERWTDN